MAYRSPASILGLRGNIATEFAIAACPKLARELGFEHCLAAQPCAAIPGAKGSAVPLVDERWPSDFLNVFWAKPRAAL
eukprot:12439497-Alexandrium_andersonii.AAC.1